MNSFTVKDRESASCQDPGLFQHRLAHDERGLLYDPRMRELISTVAGPQQRDAFEALAALGRAARRLHGHLQRHAEDHGLSEGRLHVLFRLQLRPEGIPLGELAQMLGVSPRNVTGLVDHLERDRLVSRVPDPFDRRSVLARLTEQGRELIDSLRRGVLEHHARLTEGFSSEELAQLRHLCLRLVERLEQTHPHDPDEEGTQ